MLIESNCLFGTEEEFISYDSFLEAVQDKTKNLLLDGLDWLSYLTDSSNSHTKFVEHFDNLLNMKNVVKCLEYFLLNSYTLET